MWYVNPDRGILLDNSRRVPPVRNYLQHRHGLAIERCLPLQKYESQFVSPEQSLVGT